MLLTCRQSRYFSRNAAKALRLPNTCQPLSTVWTVSPTTAVAPGLLVVLLVVPLTAGAGGESGVYDVLMSLLAAVGALQDAFEAPGHKARLASFGGLTSPPPSSLHDKSPTLEAASRKLLTTYDWYMCTLMYCCTLDPGLYYSLYVHRAI